MKTVFVLLASFSLCAQMTEIQCSVQSLERSKIHPNDEYASSQSISNNWSGYVAAQQLGASSNDGTVSNVSGSWVVPTLLPTADGSYCAIWVGIDGYQGATVEQIGTSHNWLNGQQQNYAWFEMYPNGAYEITGFPVDSGDLISASVTYQGEGVFQLIMSNHTKSVSTTIPTSSTTSTTALRACAEWVVEAPFSGTILPLADFGSTSLTNCTAVINGVSGPINNAAWQSDEIEMVASNRAVKAQPSALLADGASFQVTWKQE